MRILVENIIQGAGARDLVAFAQNEEGRLVQVIQSGSTRVVVVFDDPGQVEEVGCSAIYAGRAMLLAMRQAEIAKAGGLVGADGLPVAKG